jgi:hypothetical protein
MFGYHGEMTKTRWQQFPGTGKKYSGTCQSARAAILN